VRHQAVIDQRGSFLLAQQKFEPFVGRSKLITLRRFGDCPRSLAKFLILTSVTIVWANIG
jgi:hypothetical protein